jgi:hypothetical protein
LQERSSVSSTRDWFKSMAWSNMDVYLLGTRLWRTIRQ